MQDEYGQGVTAFNLGHTCWSCWQLFNGGLMIVVYSISDLDDIPNLPVKKYIYFI